MLVFISVPLIELALLIYVGFIIGALYTMLIVVITGVIGAIILRGQGIATLRGMRSTLALSIISSEGVVDAAMILVAGLLLITPGMIADVLGFALLVPQVRRFISNRLRILVQRRIERGGVYYWRLR
jgi:UPF0716 protein FxsA